MLARLAKAALRRSCIFKGYTQGPAAAGYVHMSTAMGPETAIEPRTKAEWRSVMANQLAQIPRDEIEAQCVWAAAQVLGQLPVYKAAKSISVFLSMPTGEIQTRTIVTDALRSGKRVYVPYLPQGLKVMEMLKLRDEQDFCTLRPDKWGIPSLDPTSIDSRENCLGYYGVNPDSEAGASPGLDLILLPAVAFDEFGNRLGHGRGYYDKYLARYFHSRPGEEDPDKKPYLIGLALHQQLLSSPSNLPTERWDYRVDAVLAGDRLCAQKLSS